MAAHISPISINQDCLFDTNMTRDSSRDSSQITYSIIKFLNWKFTLQSVLWTSASYSSFILSMIHSVLRKDLALNLIFIPWPVYLAGVYFALILTAKIKKMQFFYLLTWIFKLLQR